MSLSFTDRENLWIQAGGNPASAPLAAAISMAENESGDPNVISPSNDVGVWQINLDAHPQYNLTWLQDPLNNARAAVDISNNGGDWTPWTQYRNGAYKKFVGGVGSVSSLSSGSSCSASISLLNSQICMDGPIGLGALIIGGLVALVGFIILFASSDIGSTVAKATPLGRVASVVTR